MIREDIEREYGVKDGICMTPGKFIGESVWVPHFWHRRSEADQGGLILNGLMTFTVTDEDRAAYPELLDAALVRLYERPDDGLVCGMVTTTKRRVA